MRITSCWRFSSQKRVAQRQLTAHLPGEDQLRLREPEVRRDHLAVYRVDRLRLPGQHLAEGRLGVRIGVEVVGEVALGVRVDGDRVEPDAGEDVGQRPHRRRLAGAALLGEDCDRDRHS
jgi:hypothetical protein